MRRGNRAFFCSILLFVASTATGTAAPAPSASSLVLEVWVNGANTNIDATLVKRAERWWAASADLVHAGIRIAASPDRDGFVQLAILDGVRADIDEPDQRLMINARADCLAPQRVDLRPLPLDAKPASTTGLIGSYELSGTAGISGHGAETSGFAGAYGATLFTPEWTFATTAFSQAGDGGSQVVRLDSTAEWDEPNVPRRWLAGDAISGGLAWSRSVRFGGLQIATDFTLQPGFATFPLPAFFGQTAVPGAVDVFVNSARVFEGDVAPGPFEVDNLPVVTGSGQATVVVRNVLGQETTQTFSYYVSDALLEQGLSSYVLDAGFLRQSYGVQSFDYGAPIAAGTYRYGLFNGLTLEAHAETAASVQLLGGGGAIAVGALGVVAADAAASNSSLGQGELYSLSFQSQSHPLGVFGAASWTAGAYADLASIASTLPSRLRTQLGLDMNFDRDGAVSASWIDIKDSGQLATQLASGSYTLSFGHGWYVAATALHDFGNRSWAGELSLSIPLGPNLIGTASAQGEDHANQISAGVMRPANPDGGFGYNLSASEGDIRSTNGEATWIGDNGSLDATVSSVNGDTAARLTMSGALVAMNGAVFTTRSVDGPVALVETGNPDIPVYLENREIGVSNADGEALVTGLSANAANRIGIEPTDYALATIVASTEQTVVPRRQSGVVVDLAPPRSRPVLVILQSRDGQPLAAGGEVMLSDGDPPLLVGHDGQLFIADLEKHTEGTVAYPYGSCRFKVDPPASAATDTIPKLGPVICVEDHAHAR